MKLVTPDVVFYPPNEPAVTGLEGVRTWFQGVVNTMKTTDITISSRKVTLAGNYAIEEGQFVWKLAPAGGGAAVEERGKFIGIWQRQPDGVWKGTRDMWNSSSTRECAIHLSIPPNETPSLSHLLRQRDCARFSPG